MRPFCAEVVHIVNYLWTAGALDLGGGSTQITFRPVRADTLLVAPPHFAKSVNLFNQDVTLYTNRCVSSRLSSSSALKQLKSFWRVRCFFISKYFFLMAHRKKQKKDISISIEYGSSAAIWETVYWPLVCHYSNTRRPGISTTRNPRCLRITISATRACRQTSQCRGTIADKYGWCS
jgi:hypothetical protein